MAMIHISRSGSTLGVFDEARVREGLRSGEFIETDLGWTEGMSSWRPLSELESFGPQTAAAAAGMSSAADAGAGGASTGAAGPAATPVATSTGMSGGTATGLPWENRDSVGFLNALLATITMVLTRPAEAFTVMRKEGNMIDPLLYTIIIGTIGSFAQWLYSLVTNAIGITGGGAEGAMAWAGMGAVGFFGVIMAPIFILISTFIAAGLFHVGLMLFGGAKQPFETTLRVVAFGGGSANVFQLVPLCGGLIALVYALVLYCIGLSRAHNTDTGRAVGAVLLPVVVCCGGLIMVIAMAGGMAALLGSR
jgi:hypothetical protein